MKTKTNEYVTQLNKNIEQSGLYLRVCDVPCMGAWRPSPQLLSPGTKLGSLFIYLFQQMKTTFKSTGHEICIYVKKSFTIFSCISMHLAILQRKCGVSLANLFSFFWYCDSITSYSNSLKKSQTPYVLFIRSKAVRDSVTLASSQWRRSKEIEELEGLRQWEGAGGGGGAKPKAVWFHQLSS